MIIIIYDTLHMRSWTVPAQCSADYSRGNPDRTKQAAVHSAVRMLVVTVCAVKCKVVQVCRVALPHGVS